MPIEYIDEEMCSLAILNSTGWTNDRWFLSALKRKKEAITEDLWKMGARFYSRMAGGKNNFLDITPEEYRDEEYYREMCCCNYNAGMELSDNKGRIMESIPQEVVTPEFVMTLLSISVNNVVRFNEKALEIVISYEKDGEMISEKVWQFLVKLDGKLIRHIPLNDERVDFFLSHYDKDSFEYDFGFKENYKQYMREKNDSEANQADIVSTARRVVLDGMLYAMEGEDPSYALDNEARRREGLSKDVEILPIKYCGRVPEEFSKDYDKEEYLALVCDTLGIKINGEQDRLLYSVTFPESWTVEKNHYWSNVKDEAGNIVIKYFYDPTFWDREAYVSEINVSLGKQDCSGNKVFVKLSSDNQ